MVSESTIQFMKTGVRRPVPLIGREQELAALKEKLIREDVHLLSLIGAAGVGKTRLAQAVMNQMRHLFLQTIWVDLAPVSDPAQMLPTIAHSFGVQDGFPGILHQRLTQAIGSRRLLLILDNCEHLITAMHELSSLIELCPNLKILATSRAMLLLKWEWVFEVPLLSVPESEWANNPDKLREVPSVALFLMHVRNHIEDFDLDEENAPLISQLCIRLDGLPLAIELAAAGIGGPNRLRDSLAWLNRWLDGAKGYEENFADIPQRHRSLKASMEWSVTLLTENERELLWRLSVFSGYWTLQQAVGICSDGGIDHSQILPLLDKLVSYSLVVETTDMAAGRRYRLLETIREYALEALRNTGREGEIRLRHRDWFLTLAEQNEPLFWGSRQLEWISEIESNFDNFRTALEWSIETHYESEQGLRLWGSLGRYFDIRGRLAYASIAADKLLQTDSSNLGLRSRVMAPYSIFARAMGNFDKARKLAEECLLVSRESIDSFDRVIALITIGTLMQISGDLKQSENKFMEAVSLARMAYDREPMVLNCALLYQGLFYCLIGETDTALPILQENISISDRLGDRVFCATTLGVMGRAFTAQGEIRMAKEALEKSIDYCRKSGHYEMITFDIDFLGYIAWVGNDREQAIHLFGAAIALRNRLGIIAWLPDTRYEAVIQTVEKEIQAASQEFNSTFSIEDILSIAMGNQEYDGKRGCFTLHAATLGELTIREIEIAKMIAHGFSNAEIAKELYISKRTVDAHVRNILSKLQLHTRAQISAWATERAKQD